VSKNARRYYFYKLLAFVAYALPMGVLFGLNFKTYTKNEYTGLAFWGYVVAIFLALALKDKLTAVAKKNTLLTVSTIIFVVSLLMYKASEQMMLISGMSLLGCLLSTVFDKPAEVYKRACWDNGKKIRTAVVPHKRAWADGYLGELQDV